MNEWRFLYPATTNHLDYIFHLLQQIKKSDDSNSIILYFQAPRGSLEDFASFDNTKEKHQIHKYNEYRLYHHLFFSEPTMWYIFSAEEDIESNSRLIFLNSNLILNYKKDGPCC